MERRGATSREAIVNAARRLFAERGFEGTSVGDVADAAGLRKPTFFHHFASKEAIYREVMTELFAQIAAAISSHAKGRATFLQRLDAMNEALTTFFAAHPESARLLFREALEARAVLAGDGVGNALGILGAAAKFLESGMRSGAIAKQDSKHLVLSITGLHLTYFAIAPLATPLLGASPFTPAMVAARREAVVAQVRALVKPKRGA